MTLLALVLACAVQGAPQGTPESARRTPEPAQSQPAPPSPNAAAPSSPPASPPETPMVPLRIELHSAADAAALASAVSPLIHGDAPATDAVEIVLPGGELDGVDLSLGSALDPRRLRVHLRGQGTVLRSGALRLTGRELTVEDLVLAGGPTSGEALRLQADERVHLVGVTLLDHRAAAKPPGPRTRTGLRIEALGPAVTATLERVVGVGNDTPLRFGGQPAGRFREVSLRGCRFAESAAPVLALGPVDLLRVEDTLRLGATGPFADAESPRTLVLSEPDERPADPTRAASWRSGLQR